MQAVPAELNVVPPAVAGYVPTAQVDVKDELPEGLRASCDLSASAPAQI